MGMDGDVTVKVTVEHGTISNVEVLEQNETPGIDTNAIDQMPDRFVGLSTAEEIDALDSVSGASVFVMLFSFFAGEVVNFIV